MTTIHLSDLTFFCTHGVLPEEKIIKGEFKVSAEIIFEELVPVIERLNETVDYSAVYDIIKRQMLIPNLLLETLAMYIGQQIAGTFPFIKFIKIDIQKVNPPIQGMIGSVGVSWSKNFDQ